MKKLNILFLVAVMLCCNACQGWLTVEPKNLETKDKMFSSELGFTTALTGIYLELQSLYAPTGFMMGGSIEYLANNYLEPTAQSASKELYDHDYTSDSTVDDALGALFLSYYTIIANANTLLEAIHDQTFLDENIERMLEGETLAIRAFCHFELLRLWGPVPGYINNTTAYLPYVTTITTDLYEYHTYEQYTSFILDDFTRAEELLSEVDPILKYANSSLNTSYTSISEYDDMFWYYRQKRFNIYGIKALEARLYLWMGNNQQAYNLAKEVIEAKNPDGTNKFRLGNSSDISTYNNDYLFYSEHLVGIDINEFRDQYGAFSGRYASYVQTQNNIEQVLYEGQTDIRRNLFQQNFSYSFGQIVYGTRKYTYMTETDYYTPKSVPLIRLSEMYLILIETAPLEEANNYYTDYRTARNASVVELTESTRVREVLKEYVREYFSEGQTFQTHKRLNLNYLFMSGKTMTMDDYVLPIPEDEKNNYE